MKALKSLLCGVYFIIIYIVLIFLTPLISNLLHLLGIPGFGFFEIEVSKGGFYSKISLLGIILCFLTGSLFYYFLYPLKEYRKKR